MPTTALLAAVVAREFQRMCNVGGGVHESGVAGRNRSQSDHAQPVYSEIPDPIVVRSARPVTAARVG